MITVFSVGAQNVPPRLTATGNQSYCPTSQLNIVTSFDIIDPDDTQIDAFFIQISEGYTFGEDILILTGNHPNIISNWDASQGKLTLSGLGPTLINYTDLVAAVNDVVFQATLNTTPVDKFFSFTIGNVNFLPSTGHYYEYVPNLGISWTAARAAADARTYFGLKGYLVTVTNPDEAQITGEQAEGAGWIGGSDAETEGVWKWVTGPEAGTVFWNGGINGTTPNYANWNTNEPNDCCSNAGGDENYAHVTAPGIGIDGSWNDLPNTGDLASSSPYHPQGYIVEYGGTPGDPILNISASTKISIPTITNTIIPAINCGPQSVNLQATSSSGDILWFDSLTATTPVFTGNNFTTPVLNTATRYFALASSNGCIEGERTELLVSINPIPSVAPSITFKNCDVDGALDGFTDFNLNELDDIITTELANSVNITYHTSFALAESGNSPLTPILYNNQNSTTIYGRVENRVTGCFNISTIMLEVSSTALAPDFIQEIDVCDDTTVDGFTVFNLTSLSNTFINEFPSGQNLSVHFYKNLNDAQLEENEIMNPENYTNTTPFSEIIYVRIESDDNGNCFGIGPNVLLTVHPKPEFEIAQSEIFCLGGKPVILSAVNASENGFTYEWNDSNGSIISTTDTATITSEGIYTAVATSDRNCESFPVSYTLLSSEVSTISIEDITVKDLSDNNTITIDDTNIGIGDYEFALDNEFGTFQDSPIFTNVLSGEHIIYVRDKNGCGTTNIEVFVMGFPKFFTPNNDGVNDTWDIKGLSNEYLKNSSVSIYDRYGKLIKQFKPGNKGWDGTFNGAHLSTNDYWFVVNLVNNEGTLQVYRGHFSLIR